MYKKSDPIFRCTTPSTGKRLGVRSRRWYTTLVVYQRRLRTPNLFPVDGVVHRNIGSDFFVHLFVSLWSIKFFRKLRHRLVADRAGRTSRGESSASIARDHCCTSLEPGPSRARYFPRDMLLLTTTARERAWRLLKIHSQFFDYVFLELSGAFTFV